MQKSVHFCGLFVKPYLAFAKSFVRPNARPLAWPTERKRVRAERINQFWRQNGNFVPESESDSDSQSGFRNGSSNWIKQAAAVRAVGFVAVCWLASEQNEADQQVWGRSILVSIFVHLWFHRAQLNSTQPNKTAIDSNSNRLARVRIT